MPQMAASEAGFVIENRASEVSVAVTENDPCEEIKESEVSNFTTDVACSQVIAYEEAQQ